jgi:hypothetical protein
MLKCQIVIKIRPLGAEMFHADGQTDRHDETSRRFSQFCESAKNDREVEADVTRGLT